MLTFHLIIIKFEPHLRTAGWIIGHSILHGGLLKIISVEVYSEWSHSGADCACCGCL